jgi:hypothetical protein
MLGEALDLVEKAWCGLQGYRAKIQVILGESEKDQQQTLQLLEGLFPEDVRTALREYREKQHPRKYLAPEQEVKP